MERQLNLFEEEVKEEFKLWHNFPDTRKNRIKTGVVIDDDMGRSASSVSGRKGLFHKAQKGALRLPLPAGYQYDPDGKIIKSLDEQIVHAIDLAFIKFFEIGSVHGVVRYLTRNQIKFPRKATYEKKERWIQPYYKAIRDTFKNPIYAGTYVYGRTKTVRELNIDGHSKVHLESKKMQDWDVIIHDHHPGYITWEQYLKIQKRIEQNIAPPKDHANRAIREGSALLQGLARCGNCGRSMNINYHGQGKRAYHYYRCNSQYPYHRRSENWASASKQC